MYSVFCSISHSALHFALFTQLKCKAHPGISTAEVPKTDPCSVRQCQYVVRNRTDTVDQRLQFYIESGNDHAAVIAIRKCLPFSQIGGDSGAKTKIDRLYPVDPVLPDFKAVRFQTLIDRMDKLYRKSVACIYRILCISFTGLRILQDQRSLLQSFGC